MGMACELQVLTARQVEALKANPQLVYDVISAHSDGTAETLFDEPLPKELYLDKCWDILRFLMKKAGGQDGPNRKDWSSERLFGDEELSADEELDTGYGVPYLRSIKETKKFADFLQQLTMDQLLSHLNYQVMMGARVYGIASAQDPNEEKQEIDGAREYASDYYPDLRDYVLKAAAAECALLLWIS